MRATSSTSGEPPDTLAGEQSRVRRQIELKQLWLPSGQLADGS